MSEPPRDVPTLLDAAEEALYSHNDPATCIELCDEGLGQGEGSAGFVELTLLKAEAEMAAELDSFAERTLGTLSATAIDDGGTLCDLGQLWWTLGDEDQAGDAFARAIDADDDLADAHYGMALVHEAHDDRSAMIASFLRTLELDAAAAESDVHLDADAFQTLADRAKSELPARVLELIAAIPVLVSVAPGRELVASGADPRALGRFADDALHVYQRNLERAVVSEEQLAAELRLTMLLQTAAHFELDEDELPDLLA